MEVTIVAVGRLGRGPERALVEDYLSRAGTVGRRLGLAPFTQREIDERRARSRAAQARALLAAVPGGAAIIALDERGEELTSPGLAALLAELRDDGRRAAAFLIGGAEGLDEEVRRQAARVVSLGRLTWPHMLVRAMLAEQLYRAATILGGLPYHRG